ncbi:MAG: hypothetical protein ABSA33_05145 [Candidatus Micrarchaeaceae archaeon]
MVQKLALLGFLIISTALVASIAGAQSLNATVNSQLLESAMSQINCKTNFTVTFGNYISASLSNSNSIYPKIVALQQENAQLQNYSASANIAGFRTYVREYYDPSQASQTLKLTNPGNATLQVTAMIVTPNTFSVNGPALPFVPA